MSFFGNCVIINFFQNRQIYWFPLVLKILGLFEHSKPPKWYSDVSGWSGGGVAGYIHPFYKENVQYCHAEDPLLSHICVFTPTYTTASNKSCDESQVSLGISLGSSSASLS